MFVSATQPTLALDTREVCLALACRAPLSEIPQRMRGGEWLELSFEDIPTRDRWLMLLETAFEHADMDMPPVETVPAGAVPPYPTDGPGILHGMLLYTVLWLALCIAGTLVVLRLSHP